MRRNKFQEAYCINAAEVRSELERKDEDSSQVYAAEVKGITNGELPCYEVLRNYDGETVLFVESDFVNGCQDILKAVGIEVME